VFDYYTPVIISSENYLAQHAETAKKFMAAVSQGYEYSIAHPAEAADILIKSVPELNPEQVKVSMNYLAKEYQSDAAKWGVQKAEVWQRFIDWMFTQRLIPISVETAKAFTNDYLPQK